MMNRKLTRGVRSSSPLWRLILLIALFVLSAGTCDGAAARSRNKRGVKQTRRQADLQRHLQGGNDKNNGNGNNDKNNNGGGGGNQQGNNKDAIPTLSPSPPPTPLPSPLPTTQAPSHAPQAMPTASPSLRITPTEPPSSKIERVQILGGGELTLRFSVWMASARAKDMADGSEIHTMVLGALQTLLCQKPSEELEWELLGMDAEKDELCILVSTFRRRSLQAEDDTIVFLPPSSYVVDRSSDHLEWTSWRVTWPIVQVGKSFVLQALSNQDLDITAMDEEQLYVAAVQANQHVLNVGFRMTLEHGNLDTLLQEGLQTRVKTSRHGQEVEEFEHFAKLSTDPQDRETKTLAPDKKKENDSLQEIEETDDFFDDDRFSLSDGITESIEPKVFSPLRVVGICMLIASTFSFCIVICFSSRHRRKQKERRQLIKDRSGLLTSMEGVEEMLQAGRSTSSANAKHASRDNPRALQSMLGPLENRGYNDDDDNVQLPMPTSLQVS